MELNPNQLYKSASYDGGIKITNPEIMKIFTDFKYKVYVQQSMFSLPKRIIEMHEKHYILTASDAMKINNTHMLAMGLKRELSKVYLFDLETKTFICVATEQLKCYGDIASMEDEGGDFDKNVIMGHAQRVKALEEYNKNKSQEIDDEIEKITEVNDSLEYLTEIL